MRVLYVCKANVGRSQMAEAFHKKFSPKDIVNSAGTRIPEGALGLPITTRDARDVIQSMKEEGIDLRETMITPLSKNIINNYDKVIIMAEQESWPTYLKENNKLEYWTIEDPKEMDLEGHRKIRDQIKNKIKELLLR
jgi:protein-tyrosine-phosphatase|tara:strand:- start:96 stop:506 length:411 start_codon:yes stop_codon:yes gene_type:complete